MSMKSAFLRTLILSVSCLAVVFSFIACSAETIDPIDSFRKKAEKGNLEAQLDLGILLYEGEKVPINYFEAAKWFRKAAEQSDSTAQYFLGNMYYHGEGVPKDLTESAKWYLRAAHRANIKAQFNLAMMYYNGEGVKRDFVEALKWFRVVAEQGWPEAQFKTGLCYYHGEGSPEDFSESARWFRLAAEQGFDRAQVTLGLLLLEGKGVEANQIEALKWFQFAAAQGSANAQYHIGYMHYYGKGLSINFVEAAKWFQKAADQGHIDSRNELGGMYVFGKGVPVDYRKAAQLFTESATQELLTKYEHNAKLKTDKANKSSGTGVVITEDGIILTAGHVVKDAAVISVIAHQGPMRAHLVKIDSVNDVALIRCDGRFRAASVKPSNTAKVGKSVFTIGFPNTSFQGFDPKFTRGEISSQSGYQDDPRLWQISVPIQPGNSGGPLFDDEGNVIGLVLSKIDAIATAKITGDIPQNVNYAIKSSYFLPLLESCRSKLMPERKAWLKANGMENIVEELRESVVLVLVN